MSKLPFRQALNSVVIAPVDQLEDKQNYFLFNFIMMVGFGFIPCGFIFAILNPLLGSPKVALAATLALFYYVAWTRVWYWLEFKCEPETLIVSKRSFLFKRSKKIPIKDIVQIRIRQVEDGLTVKGAGRSFHCELGWVDQGQNFKPLASFPLLRSEAERVDEFLKANLQLSNSNALIPADAVVAPDLSVIRNQSVMRIKKTEKNTTVKVFFFAWMIMGVNVFSAFSSGPRGIHDYFLFVFAVFAIVLAYVMGFSAFNKDELVLAPMQLSIQWGLFPKFWLRSKFAREELVNIKVASANNEISSDERDYIARFYALELYCRDGKKYRLVIYKDKDQALKAMNEIKKYYGLDPASTSS